MNDNIFWVSVWTVLGVTILGLAFAIQSYWIDHNTKIVELIGQGVDPVAAMCAMQNDYGLHPVCLVLAAKK